MTRSFPISLLRRLLFSATAAVPVLLAAPAMARATASSVLPFRAVGYDSARAEAKARDLPLFVESWAPW